MAGQRMAALGTEIIQARATVNETTVIQGTAHPSTVAARGTLTHLMAEARALFGTPNEGDPVLTLETLTAGDPVSLNSPEYPDIAATGEVVEIREGAPFPVEVLTQWKGEEIVLPFALSELSPIGA